MRPKYSSTSFRWSGPYCWYKKFDKDPNEAIRAVSSAGVLYDGTPIETFLGLGKAGNSGADVRDAPEGLNGISDNFWCCNELQVVSGKSDEGNVGDGVSSVCFGDNPRRVDVQCHTRPATCSEAPVNDFRAIPMVFEAQA